MRTTMDSAGRIVVPASIRERIGLTPGPIDIIVDGTGVRIEVPASDSLIEADGRLLIAPSGESMSTDQIRELRLADQR